MSDEMPVSLAPLDLGQALGGLLKVKLPAKPGLRDYGDRLR